MLFLLTYHEMFSFIIHSIVFSLLIIDEILMLDTTFDGCELEYTPISWASCNYILGQFTLIMFTALGHKSILRYIQCHCVN
jgi:hypothetical protein